MKKIAVIKLGGRIANEGHGITSFEAVSVSKMLSIGGFHVDCFTKISDRDKPIKGLNILDINEHYESISKKYDALVVINGNINFYGGAETREQILNLHIINNFKGKVFYIFIDTLLPLKNVWKSIESKPWGKKYKKEDIFIDRDDITYVTMCYDTDAVYKITNKTCINPDRVVFFPFEKYAFFNERLDLIGNKSVDILYGANSFRNKREKKMVKYFFDLPEDINVEFYGKMKPKDFKEKLVEGKRHPRYTGPVKYNENLLKLNTSISTVNISDNFNEGTQLNPRIYETVLANVVSFMDIDYDPHKRAFTDPELRDFLYIDNKQQLVDRIRRLKNDESFMVDIINKQYENTYISKEDLSKMFSDLFNNII